MESEVGRATALRPGGEGDSQVLPVRRGQTDIRINGNQTADVSASRKIQARKEGIDRLVSAGAGGGVRESGRDRQSCDTLSLSQGWQGGRVWPI